jgi:DNA (cytosine-5)-methyltransferase 1
VEAHYKRTGQRVKRPLAPATEDRVAKGVDRYVIKAAQPFIVNLTHQGGERNELSPNP